MGLPGYLPAFRMTPSRIRRLRAYAHGRKGLDAEAYDAQRNAVGAASTSEMTYRQYTALLKRLATLPDVPRRQRRPRP